jgi:hypothetical protein
MRLLIWPTLILLASCSNDNFRSVEILSEFRVLGIYATKSEVSAPDSVDVQVLVSDVKGGGRNISATWEACVDPGVALGAPVKCDHDPLKLSGSYTVDTSALPEMFTGLGPTLTLNVPSQILLGRTEREKLNGVGYLVIFRFDVDNKEVMAFRRVSAVDTSLRELNTSPTGSLLLNNGAPLTAPPEKNSQLTITSSPAESYRYLTIAGVLETRLENYEIAWFATEGKFDKPKSTINDTVIFQGNTPSRPFLILAVIRDERGGLDFVSEYFP